MVNLSCGCGHLWQDHAITEGDMHEGKCQVEGCACEGYAALAFGWEHYVDEHGYA